MQGKKTELRTDLHSALALRSKAKSEPVRRAAVHMLAIANALDGMSFTEAARVGGIERQALGHAVKRYNPEGLDDFYDREKPGRPRKLNTSQEKALVDIIVAGPDADKDDISAYTLDDLCAIAAQRFKIKFQPSGMSKVIARRGFSRQKARPHHPEKDEVAQADFKKPGVILSLSSWAL